jgi:hypothetical protein
MFIDSEKFIKTPNNEKQIKKEKGKVNISMIKQELIYSDLLMSLF